MGRGLVLGKEKGRNGEVTFLADSQQQLIGMNSKDKEHTITNRGQIEQGCAERTKICLGLGSGGTCL